MEKITRKTLTVLQSIHRRSASKVTICRKDGKLALYILAGRVLTSCESLVVLFEMGFVTDANTVMRTIYESIWVAEQLYHGDNIARCEKWYSDKVIPPKKSRKAQANLPEFCGDVDNAERIVKVVNRVYEEMSAFAHPTYSKSIINMDEDNLFDYGCESIRGVRFFYPESFSFEQTLISVVNMFLSGRDFFEIDDSEYLKLRTLTIELDKVYMKAGERG